MLFLGHEISRSVAANQSLARCPAATRRPLQQRLGLSDPLPARVEFLTDGTSRTVKAGPIQIVLERTTPRQMAAAGRASGLVIQALRSLGPEHVTPPRLNKLRRILPAAERRTLLDDLTLAPGWMQPTPRALTAD